MRNAITFVTLKCLSQEVVWQTKTVQMQWNCSAFPLLLTGCIRQDLMKDWPLWHRSSACPSPSLLGLPLCHSPAPGMSNRAVCSSLAPAPGAAGSSSALTGAKWQRVQTRTSPAGFFSLGPVQPQSCWTAKDTQKCCSGYLDFSSFCSRCI